MKEILYYIFDTALWIPMRSYFKNVYFDGLENFPEGKPVMLAANHPNSFMDGVVFEDLFRRRVYTLTRGDVFLKPLPNFILRGLRMLPIFRSRDAGADVAKKGNAQTLEDCHRVFKHNRSIVIFSEGISKPEKAIRRVMGGTAHMTIQLAARNDFELDLHVVPVGMNYETFGTIETRMHLSFGKPIRLREYKDRILEDEKVLAAEITARIKHEFEQKIIVNPDANEAKDFAQTMVLNNGVKPFRFRVRNKKVHNAIPQINNASEALQTEILSYKSKLKELNILDENVQTNFFDYLSMFVAIISMGISLPVFLLSVLLRKVAHWIATKKLNIVVFRDSVYVGINMVFHLFWYAAIAIVAFKMLHPIWAISAFIFLNFSTHCWFKTVRQFKALWKELNYAGLDDKAREDIGAKRASILKQLFNA